MLYLWTQTSQEIWTRKGRAKRIGTNIRKRIGSGNTSNNRRKRIREKKRRIKAKGLYILYFKIIKFLFVSILNSLIANLFNKLHLNIFL